jgi:hypothetical protein
VKQWRDAKECLQREIDHKEFKSLTSSLQPCVFRPGIEVIRLSLGSSNVTTEQAVALMQESNEPAANGFIHA